MLEVQRNGKTFDIEIVDEAVAYAFGRAFNEDVMNAGKNCMEDVLLSPLTQKLDQARTLLMEMRVSGTSVLYVPSSDEVLTLGSGRDDPANLDA